MENTCFVNRLVSDVDNSDLLKLNEFRAILKKDAGGNARNIFGSVGLKITVLNGKTFGDGTTEKTLTSGGKVAIIPNATEDIVISFNDKNKITAFSQSSDSSGHYINAISNVEYFENLTNFGWTAGFDFNGYHLGYLPSLVNFGTNSNNKVAPRLKNLDPHDLVAANVPNLTGISGYIESTTYPMIDISNLGTLVKLTKINLNNDLFKGAIERLADAMVANGRTTGSLIIYGKGSSLDDGFTYNGELIAVDTYKTITFSDSGYTVE